MSHDHLIIGQKRVLTFHYELTNTQGEVLDSSSDGPMSFLSGVGHILPALEEAIKNLQPGDKKQVELAAKDAYGIVEPKLVVDVPKEDLAHLKIELGAWLQIHQGEQVRVVRVADVGPDKVTLDGNHPLAGVDLKFAIEMVENRVATAEELAHGHAHGAHGHHHD